MESDQEDLVPTISADLDISHENRLRSLMGQSLLSSEIAFKDTPNGTTWYASIFLVVNAALGAGLLNFPHAFDQAGGILVGISMQMILLIFIAVSLCLLVHWAEVHGSSSYQEVVHAMCGRRAMQVCMGILSLYCYGTTVTFLIIIGDQFDRIFFSYFGSNFCHLWYLNRVFTIIISTLIILPFCFTRRIDFLKYFSSFGVLSVLYIVGLLIYKYSVSTAPSAPVKTSPDRWTDAFLVLPTICFGYQCHVSSVPIFACLDDRRAKSFYRTIGISLAICFLTYTASAICGYLTFGRGLDSDILEMFDATSIPILVGIVALVVKTYTTYPILIFCGRIALEDLVVEMWGPRARCNTTCLGRASIALPWVLSSMVLAIFTPNIGVVIDFLGSLAASFIFIFPGLGILNAVLKSQIPLSSSWGALRYSAAILFLVVGSFIFGLVVTQSTLNDIVRGTSREAPLCT